MIFILLSSLIEGVLLPLSGSILTFRLHEFGYKLEDMLFINYAHNLPYLFFALVPLVYDSRKAILIAQILACLSLIMIGFEIYYALFFLCFLQSLIHIVLISVRKYYANHQISTIHGHSLIANRVGIAFGSVSMLLMHFQIKHSAIYIFYAVFIMCIAFCTMKIKVPSITFQTHTISRIKFDWILIFSFFLRAPEDIYRMSFNIFLHSNYEYTFIGLYKIIIVLFLAITGAYFANYLIKHCNYIYILRYSILIHGILYMLHNTRFIFYISLIEIICRSVINTTFLVHQNLISTKTYNYVPAILLISTSGSIIISYFIKQFTLYIEIWTFLAYVSFILFALSLKIKHNKNIIRAFREG